MPDYSGDVSFEIKFKDEFIDLVEQKGSVLRECVRNEPDFMEGKWGYFDRLGSTASQKQTSRHGDTPIIELPHSRRQIIRTTYEWATLVDRRDMRRMGAKAGGLANKYASKAYSAHKRDIDDVIIHAFDAAAVAVDADDATSQVTFPASQEIAANYQKGGGGSASGLTKDKITRAFTILAGNEVDMDDAEDLFAVVSENQWQDLLHITEVVSSDFAVKKHLTDPNTISFMGFTWKRSTRLGVNASGHRKTFFWHRDAMGFAGDDNPFVDVGPNRGKKAQTQVYMEWEIGATRVEEERIVRCLCAEA